LQFIGEVEQGNQKGWALVCNPEVAIVLPIAQRLVFDTQHETRLHDDQAVLGPGASATLIHWLKP
jgi:hypothetical protein